MDSKNASRNVEIFPPEEIFPGFQISAHECSNAMKRELEFVFDPEKIRSYTPIIVPTMQHSRCYTLASFIV